MCVNASLQITWRQVRQQTEYKETVLKKYVQFQTSSRRLRPAEERCFDMSVPHHHKHLEIGIKSQLMRKKDTEIKVPLKAFNPHAIN